MEIETHILAWQGWSLRVPATWNPVKIDGDYDQGSMLLADLSAARLGIRWRTAKRGDPAKWASRTLRDELGSAADYARDISLANDDWKIARLSIANDFPGRDVLAAWSETSNRVLEIVYNVQTRDGVLEDDLLPTLRDTSDDIPHRWSLFGLDFTTQAGLKLQSFALNAGDLSLTFRSGRDQTIIRRVCPASLALTRQPLDRWLTLSRANRKAYRAPVLAHPPKGKGQEASSTHRLSATAKRRRRLCWAWFLPRDLHLLAAHDESKNRLLLGTSPNLPLIEKLMSQLFGDAPASPQIAETRELEGVA